ncbi:hypothetical protein M0813_20069 [Anaeramoeba flamelloides]|uniref:Uncharacterized protein n=1 Tax=Anaeramoeba flamelloides TaxID=1746091 RepID=A0AAV8A2T6_9EUKA|nr:hypothetical protein M0812_08354 [Anaeramoeba flamelloides]KAJ6245649.1 hypothetical protein M0813_20069 [Anaeramoeba flamelloides]
MALRIRHGKRKTEIMKGFSVNFYDDHTIDFTNNYIKQGKGDDVVVAIYNESEKDSLLTHEETGEIRYTLYLQTKSNFTRNINEQPIQIKQGLFQYGGDRICYRSATIKGSYQIIQKKKGFSGCCSCCKKNKDRYFLKIKAKITNPIKDFRWYYDKSFKKNEKSLPIIIEGQVRIKSFLD